MDTKSVNTIGGDKIVSLQAYNDYKYSPPDALTAGRVANETSETFTLEYLRTDLITDAQPDGVRCEFGDGTPFRSWIIIEPQNMSTQTAVWNKRRARIFEHLNKSGIVCPGCLLEFTKPINIEDGQECKAVDKENQVRLRHNKAVVRLINEFIGKFGCGTSAGRVTIRENPNSFQQKITVDQLSAQSSIKHVSDACEYIKEAGLYPVKDYNLCQSMDIARMIAFFKSIPSKIDPKRQWYLRLSGHPPSTWDGISCFDSLKNSVRWGMSNNANYHYPDIIPCGKTDTDPTRSMFVYGNSAHTGRPYDILETYIASINGNTNLLARILQYCIGVENLSPLLSADTWLGLALREMDINISVTPVNPQADQALDTCPGVATTTASAPASATLVENDDPVKRAPADIGVYEQLYNDAKKQPGHPFDLMSCGMLGQSFRTIKEYEQTREVDLAQYRHFAVEPPPIEEDEDAMTTLMREKTNVELLRGLMDDA
jgi:hypothetical protein